MNGGISRVLVAYVVGSAAVFGSILSGVPWRTQAIVMLAALGIVILAINRSARQEARLTAAFNAWAERARLLAGQRQQQRQQHRLLRRQERALTAERESQQSISAAQSG
jgi:cell division protein FtsW (lipid II flippase)